jgi:hypothetical protein
LSVRGERQISETSTLLSSVKASSRKVATASDILTYLASFCAGKYNLAVKWSLDKSE